MRVPSTKPLTVKRRVPAVKSARCSTTCETPAVGSVSSARPTRNTSAPVKGPGASAHTTGTPSTTVRSREFSTVLTLLFSATATGPWSETAKDVTDGPVSIIVSVGYSREELAARRQRRRRRRRARLRGVALLAGIFFVAGLGASLAFRGDGDAAATTAAGPGTTAKAPVATSQPPA